MSQGGFAGVRRSQPGWYPGLGLARGLEERGGGTFLHLQKYGLRRNFLEDSTVQLDTPSRPNLRIPVPHRQVLRGL